MNQLETVLEGYKTDLNGIKNHADALALEILSGKALSYLKRNLSQNKIPQGKREEVAKAIIILDEIYTEAGNKRRKFY